MSTDHLLINQFLSHHPEVAIATIDELEIDEIASLIESLSLPEAILILSRLAPYKSGKIIETVNRERSIACIDQMPLSHAESILRICSQSISAEILTAVDPEKSRHLKRALAYDKDQVGAHLEPYVFTLGDTTKIEKALSQLKNSGAVVKPHLFVLDDANKLVGYLPANALITHDAQKTVRSIMVNVPKTVFADMHAKDLLENWDYAFTDLPVVKVDGAFIGTVSRVSLEEIKTGSSAIDKSAIKAGNALGELFTIGLTSLLGSPESNLKP